MSNRRDKCFAPVLCPSLAGNPPNRPAGAAPNKRPGIFLGQAARPLLNPLVGETRAFGMRMPQGPAKFHTAAAVQLAAHSLRDKRAVVVFRPVDLPDDFVDALHAGHFKLPA